MKEFSNFCSIFATAFIAATIILVSSCSQDDDFYESDKYTMAEELETRACEPGEGDPLKKHFFVYHEFKDEPVKCYGYIEGRQYEGTVLVSGIINKDSTAEYYWGKITNTKTVNFEAEGGASANIFGVQSHSANLDVTFTVSGYGFAGGKTIRYKED